MAIIKILLIFLTSNIIFDKALGTGTMFIASKNKTNLISLSVAIMFFTTVGSMLTYFADKVILGDTILFRPFCYIIIVSLIYVSSLLILRAINIKIFDKLKKYIHISAFNCAVFGVFLMNSKQNELYNSDIFSFYDYVTFGLKAGAGFLSAAYMLKISHIKLDSQEVPKSFRGYPVLLIYIGILSMALYSINIIK